MNSKKNLTMDRYHELFENNKKWLEKNLQQNPHFVEEMAIGQQPEFLYIGCSDSRVPANDILGLKAGQLFVHRNIANVVPSTDLNSSAVIEYAVTHLKVKHIIVCGHYGCGGVKAAMASQDLGLLNPWLRNIRDVYRLHKDELNAITNEDERFDRLVELNVQEQAINIIKQAAIQKRWLNEGYPIVHGWVFDIRTGLLKDLKIDFESIVKEIQEIYNLTDSDLVKS